MDIKPIRTSPHTSRTNGKAERCINTLHGDWAYAMQSQTAKERDR